MDGYERERLSDSALDREIAATLAVDPSPEYVARIRERVAAEAARRARGWSWSPAWTSVAALAVVVVATAGIWIRGVVETGPAERAATNPTSSRAEVADVPVPGVGTGDATGRAPASDRAPAARRRSGGARAVGQIRLAEVQISTDDAVALQHLVDAINARRIDRSSVPDLDLPVSPLPEVEAIVVDQIALSPLPALDAQ